MDSEQRKEHSTAPEVAVQSDSDLAVVESQSLSKKNADFRAAEYAHVHDIQQDGVRRIEAFSRLFGRRHPVAITLYACILAISISFCLDESTTTAYDVYATGAFNRQSYIGTIDIAQAIIIAVSKPFIAKICDVFSSQTSYIMILVSYVLGYIVVAAAPNAVALCVGRVISATGQAGFDLVTDIIVGDLSPLQ